MIEVVSNKKTPPIDGFKATIARVRNLVRVKHHGIKAEQGHLGWIKDDILYHQTRPTGDEEQRSQPTRLHIPS